MRTAAPEAVPPARALTTVEQCNRSVRETTVGLRGLPEPLCRAAHANAPSTGPGAPRNAVAQSDPEAGFANSRA